MKYQKIVLFHVVILLMKVNVIWRIIEITTWFSTSKNSQEYIKFKIRTTTESSIKYDNWYVNFFNIFFMKKDIYKWEEKIFSLRNWDIVHVWWQLTLNTSNKEWKTYLNWTIFAKDLEVIYSESMSNQKKTLEQERQTRPTIEETDKYYTNTNNDTLQDLIRSETNWEDDWFLWWKEETNNWEEKKTFVDKDWNNFEFDSF